MKIVQCVADFSDSPCKVIKLNFDSQNTSIIIKFVENHSKKYLKQKNLINPLKVAIKSDDFGSHNIKNHNKNEKFQKNKSLFR